MEFAVFRIILRDHLAWRRVRGQLRKRVPQDLLLQIAHSRFAQTISNLETVGIKRSRRTHLRRDLRADGNQDGGYSLHFNFSLNRDDRPVAYVWSTTGQHHEIGTRTFIDLISNFPCRTFVHCFELHGVTHVTDVCSRDSADEPFLFEFA